MTIRIKARSGESAEQLMRRFKKLCEKEGLTKDVKRQAYYEKPSERRRRAMRKSIKRALGPIVPTRPGRFGKGPKGKTGPGARPAFGARRGPGGPPRTR